MILVLLAAIALLSVPLVGGRLSRLGELRVRWLWIAPIALVLQLLIVSIAPGGAGFLHVAVHIGTYALIGACLWANRRLPGAAVIAVGAGSNGLAIVANAGIMPASATALRVAGLTQSGGFNNSAALSHPHLLWLGDVVPVPGPWPLHNVLSIGDLAVFAGALWLLHRTCRRGAPAHDHDVAEADNCNRPGVSASPTQLRRRPGASFHACGPVLQYLNARRSP